MKKIATLSFFLLVQNNFLGKESNSSNQDRCQDQYQDCGLTDISPHLRARMSMWAENVCQNGLNNNLTASYEKNWFSNCCGTCCDILSTPKACKIDDTVRFEITGNRESLFQYSGKLLNLSEAALKSCKASFWTKKIKFGIDRRSPRISS